MNETGDLRQINWETYGETVLNPFILILVLLMGFLILYMERKYIIIPLLIVACYVPFVQRIVIGGFDLDMMRLTILFGILRLFIRKEPLNLLNISNIDKTHYLYIIGNSIIYILSYGNSGAVVNRLGFMINAFGIYWLIRFAIQDFDDFALMIKAMIYISIPIAIVMISEQITGRNVFSVFGGVSPFSMVRDGQIRSTGAFNHPILAGTFGAAMAPLAISYYRSAPENKQVGLIGIISASIIAVTSFSSGPFITLFGGFFSSYMYKFRKDMKSARGLLWASILILTIIFQGKPYAIIWRMTVLGGSTGYHRYMLIDAAIANFREWALLGVHSTGHWGWGLNDITNMYIFEGTRGGFLGLSLFTYAIILCYKAVGNIRKKQEEMGNEKNAALIWSMGAVMFAHNVSFISVSYFGNMMFFYYLILASVASLQDYSFGPKNTGMEYARKK